MNELQRVRVFEIHWGYTKLAPPHVLMIIAPGLRKARAKAVTYLGRYGIKSTNAILEIREVASAYS